MDVGGERVYRKEEGEGEGMCGEGGTDKGGKEDRITKGKHAANFVYKLYIHTNLTV